MTYNPATYYQQLKRKLWTGTLILDVLFLAGMACFSPKQLPQAVGGVLMGVFYLWSLSFNAEHPKKGIQAVFSLIRICLLAFLIVQLSHLRVYELAIVISGLLSYKVILTVEYVAQAMQAFRPPLGRGVGAP
jgi:hypothetical protein